MILKGARLCNNGSSARVLSKASGYLSKLNTDYDHYNKHRWGTLTTDEAHCLQMKHTGYNHHTEYR